jgi:hypothetical protein
MTDRKIYIPEKRPFDAPSTQRVFPSLDPEPTPATDRKYPLWVTIVAAAPVCLLFWYFVYSVGCEVAHQAGIQ